MEKYFNKNYSAILIAIIFAIVFVVFPSSSAQAAISRVQTVSGFTNMSGGATTTSSVSATWSSTTIAGNLLVAIITVHGGSAVTITPPAGLGWTSAVRVNNGTNITTAIYYIQNAAAQSGASTWNLSFASSRHDSHIDLIEYSGALTSLVLDRTASTTGNSSTANSGTTLATTQADEVAVAGLSFQTGGGATIGAPTNSFSQVDQTSTNGVGPIKAATEEKILAATGTQNTAGTLSTGSAQWVGAIATFKAQNNNPVPTTTSISPTSATYGGVQFTLTVNGTNFIASSVVNFAGSARTTTFVSSTQLTAIIPASDLLAAGTYNITVFNPTPGGGTSNAQTFTVNKANQATLTLTGQTVTYPTAFATLSTSGGSGTGAVTYAVTTPGAGCSIAGSTLSYTSAGTCGVTATKAADSNYNSTSSIEATFTVNNPIPTTTNISPTSKNVGDAQFTLTVNGTNFVSSSIVKFSGSSRTTTYISSTQLTAVIPASDLTIAGTYNITVTNPTPGGGTSNAQTFTVNNLTPTTTSISPTSKNVGDTGFTLTVNGTNFVSGSVVKIAGSTRTTTFVSSTQLTASILTSDLTTAGTFSITVENPTPGGGTSNAQTFTVNNLVPTTTSISPTSKTAGDSGFTLTVNGTNFITTSVVNFAGSARTTTFVSSTQLTASILTSDLITAGTFAITVTNPTPGGGTSNAQTFTVNNPVPTTTSISPTSKTAGASGFTLTVNGTNFVSTSVVNFAGSARTTTFISSTQLTASILASDIATAGTYNITVTNPTPGGGTSNAQVLTVNNPTPTTTSISPSSVTAGAAQLTLTVNGTNFISSSVVNFNGVAKTTTFVSSTQVTAIIPASNFITAGSYSVTVTNPTPGGGTSNAQTFTVNPGPLDHFSFATIATQTAGTAFSITITAQDIENNTVTSFTGKVDLTTNAGTISPTLSGSFVNGVRTESVTVTQAGTLKTITATDHAGSGATGTSNTFTVNVSAFTKLQILVPGETANPGSVTGKTGTPTAQTAGSSFSITVNSVDDNWNVVSSTDTVAITSSDLAAGLPSNAALIGGTKTFTATLNTAGTATLTATDVSNGSKTANTSPLITVNVGPLDHFAITTITTQTAGTAFNITVTAKDVSGNTVTSFTGKVDLTTNAGTISPTLSGSFVNGVRTENVVLDPGSTLRTITATDHAGSGKTGTSNTFTVNNPTPTTTSISPTSKNVGDTGFTLTVNGTNFVSTSVVYFNGSIRTTAFISSTQVTASILTSDLITAGTYNITVVSPAPGGGVSNAQIFSVDNLTPTTTSISPTSKTVGDSGFTLTVNGTNFLSGSVVKFNGASKTTTYVSSTQLTATILASDITTAGSFLVVVENPSPGGGDSNAQIFVVHNLIPSTTSISPFNVQVGVAQFTMTINGSNFVSNSQVNFSGIAKATTFISSTQLSAVIPATDLTNAGTFSITVFNPSTGETSNAQQFTVGPLGRQEFNYSKTFYGAGTLRK